MIIKGKKFPYPFVHKLLPNGHTLKFRMIHHPGAALMVPFLSDGKIILLRQFRAALDQFLYELPAGTLDKGEHPLTCAKRELIEETGYSAGKLTKLGKIFPVPGYSDEVIHIYKAENLFRKFMKKDPDEVIQVKALTVSQVKDFFARGRITDAKTICGLAVSGLLAY